MFPRCLCSLTHTNTVSFPCSNATAVVLACVPTEPARCLSLPASLSVCLSVIISALESKAYYRTCAYVCCVTTTNTTCWEWLLTYPVAEVILRYWITVTVMVMTVMLTHTQAFTAFSEFLTDCSWCEITPLWGTNMDSHFKTHILQVASIL